MIEDYNIYELDKKEILAFYIGFAFAILLFGELFFSSFAISSFFLLLLLPGKKIWSKHLAEKRKKMLMLQFRDLLYSLSASASIGRQMTDGLKDAIPVVERIYGSDAVLLKELNIMVKKIFDTGENDEFVLKDFAERTKIKEIMNFADVYSVSKKTGADLQKVIRKTVELLLGRIEAEREMKAMTSQKRLEFAILSVMPPGALLFLRVSSPYYLEAMYAGVAGRVVMSFALLSLLLAAYMSYKMTQTSL